MAVSCRAADVVALLGEALLPAPDAGLRLAGPAHDPIGPMPSALCSTIRARQTCFWATLRSPTSASRRRRSAGLKMMLIPGRMSQTRTQRVRQESPSGFKCQILSTSVRLTRRSPSTWRASSRTRGAFDRSRRDAPELVPLIRLRHLPRRRLERPCPRKRSLLANRRAHRHRRGDERRALVGIELGGACSHR